MIDPTQGAGRTATACWTAIHFRSLPPIRISGFLPFIEPIEVRTQDGCLLAEDQRLVQIPARRLLVTTLLGLFADLLQILYGLGHIFGLAPVLRQEVIVRCEIV